MRFLRGLAGALLWVLGSLLGLVALVLCVTVILLPVGIPLLRLSRRLVAQAVRLMMPRPVAHPVKSLGRGSRRARRKAGKAAPTIDLDTKKLRKRSKKALKRVS